MTDTRHAPPPASRRIPGFPVLAGPFSHLAAERDRLAALRWRHFDAEQVGVTVGAQISGVDLTQPLSGEVFDELRTALHEYKVLFVRDQPMSPQAHAALARQFGPVEVHPLLPSNGADPALARFQKDATVSGFENAWHHDVTWRREPSIVAILHAIAVPPIGGDTLFSDMYAAYDSLDAETRREIDGLDAVHDFTHYIRELLPEEKIAELQDAHPPVTHPVVCTHPVTGRRHLYVNRMFVSHIAGYSEQASLDLLDRLCRTADAPEHQCRYTWAPDSVAIWDNRAVQHYAASDYWPHTRIMERASVTGPVPSR